MFKKSLVALSLLALVGCGGSNYHNSESTEPKYKITEQQMKQAIAMMKGVFQCTHPQAYEKYKRSVSIGNWGTEVSKEITKKDGIESHVLFGNLWNNIVMNVIGQQNYAISTSDIASRVYADNLFQQIDVSSIEPEPIPAQDCKTFRKTYAEALKQAKREREKQEKEELARKQKEEQERRAREAYLATPQGQAELSRLQLAEQHRQMMAQQQAMHNEMLAQQRAAQQQAAWQQQQMMQQQQFNQNMQMINQMNDQLRMQGGRIGQGWAY